MLLRWRGILASEGEMTGDGRHIEPGALDLSQTPSPLQFVREASSGHDGAVTVGNITMMRRDGDDIYAEGTFRDTDESDDVADAVSLVVGEFARGVSIDMDSISFELLMNSAAFDEVEEEERDDDMVRLFGVENGDEVFNVTSGRIRGATLVSIPAFANAFIEVLDEEGNTLSAETLETFRSNTVEATLPNPSFSLVASAPPTLAPSAAFENPNLSRLTPLTVRDGLVFGHIAGWDTCHVGFDGQCITAPSENGDYSWFHVSSIQTDAGEIAVGRLTYGGGHAGADLSARPAMAHYDNVGTTAAFVRCGEDEHGIWFSGVVADGISDSDLRGFSSAPLSGDWRRIGGQLRLVAACSVNTPGFPIARVASGEQMMMVASAGVPADEIAESIDAESVALRVFQMLEERDARRENEELAALLKQDIQENLEMAAASITASVDAGTR